MIDEDGDMVITLDGVSPADTANTIYYLRTCQPHINDISWSGPYATPDALAEQIRFRLVSHDSFVGFEMLEELMANGSIVGTHHFNAPLPDGTILRFEIEREVNPDVKAALPCPVYHVFTATPMLGVARETNQRPHLPVPMEKMETICTRLTKAAALEEWREAVREVQEEMPGSRVHMTDELGDEQTIKIAMILGRRRQDKHRTVQMRYDDGRIEQVDA